MREIIKEEVEAMLEADMIEPSGVDPRGELPQTIEFLDIVFKKVIRVTDSLTSIFVGTGMSVGEPIHSNYLP